jgi:hypothetical protein
MMAGEELEKLLQSQRDAQKLAQSVEITGEDYTQPVNRNDIKSSPDYGASIATAVAAGFLLGPVGGLAMGIAQGIVTKRERKNQLDRMAEETNAYNDIDETLNNEINRLTSVATSEEDIAQLQTLRTRKDIAMRGMISGSPTLNRAGMEELSKVNGLLTSFAENQEAQRIEKEAYNAELRRALDEQGYQRHNDIQNDFEVEAAVYNNLVNKTNLAIEALNGGNTAEVKTAIKSIEQALEPGAIVRDADIDRLTNLGTFIQGVTGWLDKQVTGAEISPGAKDQLYDLLGTIVNNERSYFSQREEYYYERLKDAQVPEKYWDQYNLVDNLKYSKPDRMAKTNEGQDDSSAIARIGAKVNEKAQQAVENIGKVADDPVSFVDRFLRDFNNNRKFLMMQMDELRTDEDRAAKGITQPRIYNQ